MKRIFLYAFLGLVVAPCMLVNAQKLTPHGDIRKMLSNHLQNIGVTDNSLCDTLSLHVWSLLSNKQIRSNSDLDSIGIYGFKAWWPHQNIYVLMKYHDDYEVFEMTGGKYNESINYADILNNLISYFSRHPNLDYRLMPTYNKIIYDVFLFNTGLNELGPWFDWYESEQKQYTGDNDISRNPNW